MRRSTESKSVRALHASSTAVERQLFCWWQWPLPRFRHRWLLQHFVSLRSLPPNLLLTIASSLTTTRRSGRQDIPTSALMTIAGRANARCWRLSGNNDANKSSLHDDVVSILERCGRVDRQSSVDELQPEQLVDRIGK